MQSILVNWTCSWILGAAFFGPCAFAQDVPVHGLWVWKTASLLEMPRAAAALRDFCRSEGVTEIYISFSGTSAAASEENRVADLIALLHRSNLRMEALLSSTDAYEPGKPREKLLSEVRSVLQFNQRHPKDRFDGIHLDIEPQQLPQNKGEGNLQFLPALLETYRAVRTLAEQAQMTVNADIPNKFLKGDLRERTMLLSALPRLTLMLYELSGPTDKETPAEITEKLRNASQRYLDMAYEGVSNQNVADKNVASKNVANKNLAKMSIALRTPDYGESLPAMLKSLDDTLRTNPRYLGWGWHSYNDQVKPEH
jgi:hypothetical protein